jgi:ferredoxin-NADP reductase/Na+-translocating ferredoxin:NAD+ oxidoreductase RnfD subunit
MYNKHMSYLDTLLNRITMYKLVEYGLLALIIIAELLSLTGVLSLPAGGMALTTGLLFATCYASNWLLARLYGVASNNESSIITALILACILPATSTLSRGINVVLCGLIAIASKYIIAIHAKHIFNPAAFGAAVSGVAGLAFATWWIGTPVMAGFVIVFGIAILRKIHRAGLFVSFFVASVAMTIVVSLVHSSSAGSMLHSVLLSGPLLFLGFLMLTEPGTTPPVKYYQILYGFIVGLLFAAQLHIGNQSITPEIALIIGNIFAYSVSFRRRLRMKLISKEPVGAHAYTFTFEPDQPFMFRAGQYMEWTLPHKHLDWRGNRRTFSIASSPGASTVQLGMNIYEPGSSFKNALTQLTPGDHLFAGNLAGDFTLPSDTSTKLVWIAGGIGITPFRSMARYLQDTKQKRDISLLYIVTDSTTPPYKADFEAARSAGVQPTYMSRSGEGLTAEVLKTTVPDYSSRSYYISGSPDLVTSSKKMLTTAGIPRSRIKTDFFSGY